MNDIEATEVRHERVQVIHEPRPAVETLKEIALHGEPATDRAFVTPSGTRFRARLVKAAEVAAIAPTARSEELAPATITLSLSLAMLDSSGNVATDANGRLLITDAHEIILSPGRMVEGLSIEDAIDLEIRKAAYALERAAEQRTAVDDFLGTKWGGGDRV